MSDKKREKRKAREILGCALKIKGAWKNLGRVKILGRVKKIQAREKYGRVKKVGARGAWALGRARRVRRLGTRAREARGRVWKIGRARRVRRVI